MAVDFQVVFPQEIITLSSVVEVAGMAPRTLNVIGQDFRSVDQVTVNGFASPEVVVISRRRLLAQVPPQLGLAPVTNVSVVSTKLSLTNKSLISFQIGPTSSKVSGILRLVQLFLKILFTTAGSDIFAPRIGATGLKDIGATFGGDEGGAIISDFIISVATAQRQILAIQARDPSLPPDEKLLSAIVLSAEYNQQEAALIVSVEITSQTGRSALANVAV